MAAGLAHPERVAGFHFFNPVPLMKVVEVVAGLVTDPAAVDRLAALAERMGHTAVRAKDTPGFIVNHAGRGFGTEGLRILAESVTGVEDLDRILRDTAGFKLGPCELMDLTGLDVSHPVMESVYHQFYDEPRFRPQPLTRQMVAAGLLGRKTSRGFYAYRDGVAVRSPEPAPSAVRPASVWVSRSRPALAARVVALLRELGGRIDDGTEPSTQSLCIVTPLGEDATTLAVREHLDPSRTVAVDAVFDLSRRRVVMTTPLTTAEWREAARGLAGADGVPVTVIRDSTGLVAQRVVATIVNIAAEIAQQRIAAPGDVDRAVVLGLGYPSGPLAWGDRLGPRVVLEILDNIHALTRDPRYRPSPWLRRRAELAISLLTPEV
jgi:3-hydroxybutyryl-CoA dehydrogenase